jgi:hypothetical protein
MPIHFRRLTTLAATLGVALGAGAYLASRVPRATASGTSGMAVTPAALTPEAFARSRPQAQRELETEIVPLLTKYCVGCHNHEDKVADLALDTFTSVDSLIERRRIWDLVSKYVRTQQMPPEGDPEDGPKQPTEQERATLTKWIDGQLYAYYASHPDPGRVLVRRMNRSEYNHTIQDLVGVEFQPADDFPQDDSGYGFDNVGDVLSLPPVLMEKYLAAADRILDEALPTEPPARRVRHFAAAQAEVGFNAVGDRGDGWVQLISLEEDDVAVELPVPAGDYLVRVKAFMKPAGGALVGGGSNAAAMQAAAEPVKLGVFVGDTYFQDLVIDATEDAPKSYEARVGVAAGKQRFRVSMRRNRGGKAELNILNGRIGTQQPGIAFIRSIEVEGPLPAAVTRFPAKKLDRTGEGSFDADGAWIMKKNGQAEVTIDVPRAGEYLLRAKVSAQQAGAEPVRMEMRVNGNAARTVEVLAPATLQPLPNQRLFDIFLLNARPYVYETKLTLPAGKVELAAAFVNDFEDPEAANPNLRDRNLIVHYLELVNLQETQPAAPMPETFAGYFVKKPGDVGKVAAARDTLERFTRRAYRRPVKAGEIDRLMQLFDMAGKEGASYEEAIKLSMKAVLVSPHFLLHGVSGAAVGEESSTGGAIRPIPEFALASRLSYFLWSSMPDDALLELAERGELRNNLETQVKRMLASPKSRAFSENFSSQWLLTRGLPDHAPDRDMFREFDDGLRKAMAREPELLFDYILREDRPVLEFLTADYTFVNGRLARFYGLPGVAGEHFEKVSLAGTPRRGVLTQGGVLMLTSNPTRTSPVKRGKFVLEQLLGTPPPPPPPDVPQLEAQHELKGTLRQQMEAHRANPVCASCHAQMDPIGFGLENFDAIGRWRERDGGQPVDAAGTLRSGDSFRTAAELVQILSTKRRDDFVRALAEKTLTYALGRGVEPFDRPAVEGITRHMAAHEDRFSALVMGVVTSMPFQMERAGADDSPGEAH